MNDDRIQLTQAERFLLSWFVLDFWGDECLSPTSTPEVTPNDLIHWYKSLSKMKDNELIEAFNSYASAVWPLYLDESFYSAFRPEIRKMLYTPEKSSISLEEKISSESYECSYDLLPALAQQYASKPCEDLLQESEYIAKETDVHQVLNNSLLSDYDSWIEGLELNTTDFKNPKYRKELAEQLLTTVKDSFDYESPWNEQNSRLDSIDELYSEITGCTNVSKAKNLHFLLTGAPSEPDDVRKMLFMLAKFIEP